MTTTTTEVLSKILNKKNFKIIIKKNIIERKFAYKPAIFRENQASAKAEQLVLIRVCIMPLITIRVPQSRFEKGHNSIRFQVNKKETVQTLIFELVEQFNLFQTDDIPKYFFLFLFLFSFFFFFFSSSSSSSFFILFLLFIY